VYIKNRLTIKLENNTALKFELKCAPYDIPDGLKQGETSEQ
jgi:hypothetical protein